MLVPAITASGIAGAGGCLSQPLPAAQSRTYCLSKLGCDASDLEALRRPVARGVRRQHLVAEHQRAVLVEPELELGVGEDHAVRARVLGRERVEGDRDSAHALHQLAVADELGRLIEVDRLVVAHCSAFVLGVKIGSGRRSDSRRPRGSGMPEIAPVAW